MPEKNRVGALIVFAEGVTKEMVEAYVEKIRAAGKLASAEVQEFSDAHEMWPTFYIP